MAIDTTIPAFLKRETNAKGITLSAGPADQPQPATVVSAGKSAKAQAKAEAKAKREAEQAEKREARAKAKADKEAAKAKPAIDTATEPTGETTEDKHPEQVDQNAVKAHGETGTVIDPATGEPVVKVKRSIVPMRFKDRYKAHGGTCGDDMALELKAATTMLNADKRETLDWEALKQIADDNGIRWQLYEGLNNGQKRMNVGNKLRGLLKAGKDVTVGTRVFKAEDMPV